MYHYFGVHPLHSCVYCCIHRSLWTYKASGWGRNHWFWWRLWWCYKVGTKLLNDELNISPQETVKVKKKVLQKKKVWVLGSAIFCRMPEGLEDVSKVPKVVAELLRRGWSDAEVKAALGENLLRVFKDAEKVSNGRTLCDWTIYQKYRNIDIASASHCK